MAETTKKPKSNPFMTPLISLAVIGLAVWAIAGFLMLVAAQDHKDVGMAAAWSMLGGMVGYPALLVYLLVGALRHKD